MYPIQDGIFDCCVFATSMLTANYIHDVVRIHEHAIEVLKTVYSPGELLALDAFRVVRFVCFCGSICSIVNIIAKLYADFTIRESAVFSSIQGRVFSKFDANENKR